MNVKTNRKKKLLNNLKNVSDFNRLSLGDPDRFIRKSPQDYLIFDKPIRGTKDIEIRLNNGASYLRVYDKNRNFLIPPR